MTQKVLPNYKPYLEEIKENKNDDYKKITEDLIVAGHIGKDEDLLDVINKDKITLSKYGLTKEDIYQIHHNMYILFTFGDDYTAKTNEEHGDHAKELVEKFPEEFGSDWCSLGQLTNEIYMNHNHFRITCIIWKNAERCPIESYYSDDNHDGERGHRDWLISNLTTGEKIWVPDLVPAQVGMFGFFQGEDSKYRVDPEKYIKVMAVEKYTDEYDLEDSAASSSGSSISSDSFIDFKNNTDRKIKPIKELHHYQWSIRSREVMDDVNYAINDLYSDKDTDDIDSSRAASSSNNTDINNSIEITKEESCNGYTAQYVVCKDYSIPNNPNECTYLAIKFNKKYINRKTGKTILLFTHPLYISGDVVEMYNDYITKNVGENNNAMIFKLTGSMEYVRTSSNTGNKSSCNIM